MKRKTKKYAKIIMYLTIIVAATASWAFYEFINEIIGDLLINFGITSSYAQLGLTLIVAITVLIILGFSANKALDKVVKG